MQKRTVSNRACDNCRARRTKCAFTDATDSGEAQCDACRESTTRCTFELLYKKRGPPPKSRAIMVNAPTGSTIYDLPRALEAFCSHQLAMLLVQHFVDHLYPLFPVVHLPTFQTSLEQGTHKRDTSACSLLVSIIVTTLCAIPKMTSICKEADSQFTFMSPREVLEAGERLILQIRPSDHYDMLTLDKWACTYLLTVANAHLGHMQRSIMHHSEATTMVSEMRLHKVETYKTLNAIEAQLSKKALWMNFTSERHLEFHHMRDDLSRTHFNNILQDASELLPLEIDDEYLTKDKVMVTASDQLALVAGLNALTSINRLMVQIPARYNNATCRPFSLGPVNPPYGSCNAQEHESDILLWVSNQLHMLEHCLDDVPPELGPNQTQRVGSCTHLVYSQYETMRANIHVTHAWARSVFVDQVFALYSASPGEVESAVGGSCAKLQHRIACQLLDVLSTLPKINLLPNGAVLIRKVRSIGASILEHAITGPSDVDDASLQSLIQSYASLLAELDLEHYDATSSR